jgi:helicase, putative, RecD/TraA family
MEYTGVIVRVRFYSDETKFIVANVEVEEENDVICMTGYMSYVNEEEKYRFTGDYVTHPRYGKQFQIESYEVIRSNDEEEIVRYLSSSLFKGIGVKQATLIVQALGENTIDAIKEDKHVLDHIKGMSEVKRDMIYNVLVTQDFDSQVLSFFLGHGISTKNLALIQGHYQEDTLNVLQNNPYQLIEDIDGIGFKTADDLALKIGVDPLDENRLKAAVLYCLKERCFQTGGTYQYYESFYSMFNKLIQGIFEEKFNELLNKLISEEKIIQEGEKYYSYDLYHSEQIIVEAIKRWLREPKEEYSNILEEIEKIEEELSLQYDKKQKEAIESFIENPLMIITGGPGTGKTTIVQGLLKIYQAINRDAKVALIAPTGRAAKRMSEITGLEACTIHRLLKWDMHSNVFAMNEDNPLDYDLLIIDEFSMVDSLLFSHLIKASYKVSKILLVGDDQQLPSVAPGTVLKDLLDIEDIPKLKLTHIYRQSQESGIIQLAHHLRNDDYQQQIFLDYPDLYFQHSSNTDIVKNIELLIQKAIDEGFNENDIQVLAPMYQGVGGINAFNESLQALFNPPSVTKNELKVGRRVFREGDKILQLKNRVDDNVFNGDIGKLVEICYKDNFEYLEDTIIVDFDGVFVEYTPGDFSTITHAYCISIHKAQGNEFPIVIMAVLNDYYIMLRKNLIYTGITRAKRTLFVVGSHHAFLRGLSNSSDEQRLTSLKNKFYKKDISLYDFE